MLQFFLVFPLHIPKIVYFCASVPSKVTSFIVHFINNLNPKKDEKL